MFRTESNVFAARAGRIAFGAYLIAGAILLVLDVTTAGGRHAFEVMVGSWLVALGMGRIVRMAVGVRPAPRDRWLLASLVVPGIGLAFMMPLFMHLPIVWLLGGADGFDSWTRMSFAIVGPVHLALVTLVTLRAVGLVRGTGPTPTPGLIYAAGVAISFVSGAELLFIPTILVAITGLAIVPVIRHMATLVESERALLPAVPPRAIALLGHAA